jgi:hypothetical protein
VPSLLYACHQAVGINAGVKQVLRHAYKHGQELQYGKVVLAYIAGVLRSAERAEWC